MLPDVQNLIDLQLADREVLRLKEEITALPKRVAAIEVRLRQNPGLSLAGNAYYGIGIPDCVRMGKLSASGIVASTSVKN